MPIRVKNVAMGFRDSSGIFRPIRASEDYSSARVGEGSKKKAKKAAPKRKAAKKTKRTTKRVAKRTANHPVKRAAKRGVKRSKNPIPTKFTAAKVRRLPSGDIQVLIAR